MHIYTSEDEENPITVIDGSATLLLDLNGHIQIDPPLQHMLIKNWLIYSVQRGFINRIKTIIFVWNWLKEQ